MEFEGNREIEADEHHLWELISDPEVLVQCVPGAKEVTQESETRYTGIIERSFAGLSVELDGDVEMQDLVPPDHMTVTASGLDRITKTEMDAEGRLTLEANQDNTTVLNYEVDMEFSGKLPAHLLKSRIDKDIGRFFDNVQDVAEHGLEVLENDGSTDEDTEKTTDDDSGGLLSRF